LQISDHLKGIILTTLGVIILSPDALLMRLLDADTFIILFWRGITFAVGIFILMLLMYRGKIFQQFAKAGSAGIFIGALFGSSTLCFTAAIQNTSISNTLVIISTSPMFAALFSCLFLKEKVKLKTWIAMFIIVGAIAIIMSNSFSAGNILGDLCALGSSIFIAATFTYMRGYKEINMIPAMAISGVITSLVAILLIAGTDGTFLLKSSSVPYLIIAGFTVTIAFALITLGPRYMPAPEVGLIMPLETVLGSYLGWIFLKEEPTLLTFIGGAIVIATLIIHAWLSLNDDEQSI